MRPVLAVALVLACAAALAFVAARCGEGRRDAAREPPGESVEPTDDGYVGGAACASCHAGEHAAWQGSHHDLAMQEATDETVLGDFDDATFEYHGVTSSFTRRGDRFVVRTEDDEGALSDFVVAYTFGASPLQQYLVALPGGRLQALPFCWDARPSSEGGGRWFHLYPDERVAPGDELFWTGREQNWNSACADCHSTRLRRGYDAETDTFATTWSEIDVSCEACHGPGAAHVAWAAQRADGKPAFDAGGPTDVGLSVALHRSRLPPWEIDPATGTAKRERRPGDDAETAACARCHSRRSPLRDDYVHGRPLGDTHRVALLDPHLYFADGQIKGEVFVHGSFVQSRMHAAGVGCTDCHDPHSLRLRADGNALCTRCHLESAYDVPAHHRHDVDGPGAECVGCHMPERTYMVVDPRRDHSLRVPRPDLSQSTGAPNACNGCHSDRTAAWAAEHVAGWHGNERASEEHYGTVLDAARRRAPGYRAPTIRLIGDVTQPAIARATALDLLRGDSAAGVVQAATSALRDADPLVRASAAGVLGELPPPARGPLRPLLSDDVRLVRVEAARALAESTATMRGEDLAAMTSAFDELIASERAAAERPESHVNVGNAFADAGRLDEAERSFRTALRLAPDDVPALVNLADVLRARGRPPEGEAVLAAAARRLPNEAALHHALGLLRTAAGRTAEALPSFARAAELAPHDPRHALLHGLALAETGDLQDAVAVLDAARRQHPRDSQLLRALFKIHRDAGDRPAMFRRLDELIELHPGDETWQRLRDSLRRGE